MKEDMIATVKRLKQLAEDTRDKYIKQWRDSVELLHGDQKRILGTIGRTGSYSPQVNRTANAVNMKYAILTEVLVRPVIEPVNNNEVVDIYLSEAGVEKLKSVANYGMDVEELAEKPVKLEEFAQVMDQDGQPLFNELDFIRVDSDMAADAMTEDLQNQWRRAKADGNIDRGDYHKLCLGHVDHIIQWDNENYNFEISNLHPLNVWIDPQSSSTDDADYVIIDVMLDIKEAKKLYPQAFDDNGNDEGETVYGQRDYGHGVENADSIGTDYDEASKTKQITKTVAFLRDSEFKRKVDPVYEEGEDGELVEVEQHVTYHGIRQVEIINNKVVFDAESDFPDLPMARNFNIPRVHSPFGVGEPEYLMDLQNLYNRLWAIVYENGSYYRAPTHVVPDTVLKKIKRYLMSVHSMAGQFIPVPDEAFMMTQGNPISTLQAPEMNTSWFQLLNFVSQEIDRLAGLSNVMRGEAYSGWSGDLYEQATSNARTPVGIAARNKVAAIKHLMSVAVKMTIEFTPSEVLAERNRAFSPRIWRAIKRRIETMDYDFNIQVSAANKKEHDAQRMANLAQTNPALMQSPTFAARLMEKEDIPDGKQVAQEVEQIMAMQAQSQQSQASPPSPPSPQ